MGQTTCSIEKRWKEHIYNAQGNPARSEYPLYHAIRKYGAASFSTEILYTTSSQDDLNEKEKFYIRQYRTLEKQFGYNRHEGGNKPPVSTPESRKKAGLKLSGRKLTKEHKDKISASNKGKHNAFLGRHHSEESKQKMSRTQKERCARDGGSRLGLKSSTEHIEKIRIANTGKRHTAETKAKISLMKTNPSAETREKLRQSHLGKKQSSETIAKRSLTKFLKTVAWG